VKAPQGGGKALRAMRACEQFGLNGEKMVFWPSERRVSYALN
tara:strand:+ start:411 stop:536 length:126 start_codon:yes stop_codon:yes gene_type:complete